MAIKMSYNSGFQVTPEGTYTVLVDDISIETAKNGNEYLSLRLAVQNNEIVKTIRIPYWQNADTGEYRLFDLMNIAKAFGIPEDTEYQSYDEFFAALSEYSEVPISVRIEHYTNPNTGKVSLNLRDIKPADDLQDLVNPFI
ncbi:hypothetical protein CG018_07625 [Gemella sp. ND 6198]|uniref:DUF669 domain-containing protein n=1 Tax=Gemella sp. ND 6198 TaxID=2040624 RepID=UPI000E0AA082|nr:DUF669 domain-containing protein [Gemella sp. ND 6198]AXI27280.1 hypothetical protein CG018_07625 [Gemella sp. ND 6198]